MYQHMGIGLDHEVVGHGESSLIRRRLPGGDGLEVAQETELLNLLRGSVTLAVPRVLASWPERGEMEMERLPGEPLLGLLPALDHRDRVRLGTQLGGFVASLAAVPTEKVDHLVPLDVAQPDELIAEAAAAWDYVRPHLPDEVAGRVGAFFYDAPVDPCAEACLTHQDLGAEHVFVDTATKEISGVIDWSDAVLGDPAFDLGLVLRDLGPDAGAAAITAFEARGHRVAGLVERSRFFARVRALEDLAFGLTHGAELYSSNARRAIARLWP